MLVETENYAAVSLLQHEVLKDSSPIPLFGSSFRLDQSYTEVSFHGLKDSIERRIAHSPV